MDSIFALLGTGASFDSRRFPKDAALVRSKPAKESGERRQEAGDKRRGDEPSAGRSKARKRYRGSGRTACPSDVQVFSRTVTAGGTLTGGEESSDKPESQFVCDDTVVNTRDPHEEANVLRKQHRIKVTGSGVPPPLRSFADVEKVCSTAGLDCLGKQEGPALLRQLLENLVGAGFVEPTPIQRQAVPCLLAGAPLLAIAPTGSGKTLAFVLPCLLRVLACKLLRNSQKRRNPPPLAADAATEEPALEPSPVAALLCPTRELAGQTMRVLQQLKPGLGIRAKLVSKASTDASNLARVDVLVSTPMRLVAAVQAGQVALATVRMLVLDEADKLLELGMLEQVDELMAAASHPSLTRALFSATIPSKVEELARSVMHDPVRVTVGVRNTAAASIRQKLLFAGSEEGKLLALRQMVSRGVLPPVLVFVASKDRAQSLHREMKYDGLRAACIHADQTQAARNAAVERFRAGDTWMLIATDLLGRGMDFLGVSTVINYDLPRSAGDYIHRIGRTGRAGKSGEAVTFFTEDDADRLRPIVNTMREAGCSVPDWMLQLPKAKRTKAKSRKKPT